MYRHVFGPVPSRRLGISLGVDMVIPKSCNMNCVFCECGVTEKLTLERKSFKDYREVIAELDSVLSKVKPDYVTFSGSGEPTLSLDIGKVIDWIKRTHNVKVCVITNSLLLEDDEVIEEIKNADLVIPTLNSVDNTIFKKINRASIDYDVENVKRGVEKLCKNFDGEIFIETFIIEGLNDGDRDIEKMCEFLKNLKFTKLQLNSLDRRGTEEWVKPASAKTLERVKRDFEKGGIENVEIVSSLREVENKLEVDENLVKNMEEKRKYTEEELKKIYKI